MKKPKISKNFTLKDIRKIREYNSKIMQKMTVEEQIEYINKDADKFKKEMEEYKKSYNNEIKASRLAEKEEKYYLKDSNKKDN